MDSNKINQSLFLLAMNGVYLLIIDFFASLNIGGAKELVALW